MPPHNAGDPPAPDNAWRFSGFAIPTTTPVPDQLFDELMPRLSPAELVVTLYIIRRTFGFKKTSDTISLRQLTDGIVTRDGRVLDSGTGLSKATVARALNSLETKAVIIRARNKSVERGDEPTTYQLNFLKAVSHSETPPLSQPETPPVSSARQGVSHQRDTQQTVRQQTDVLDSNTATQPQLTTSSGTSSKFRKGPHPIIGQDRHGAAAASRPPLTRQEEAAAPAESRFGISTNRPQPAHPRGEEAEGAATSQQPAPRPRWARQPAQAATPTDAVTSANDAQTPGRPIASRVTAQERQSIQGYLGDFAPELGDNAPFKSSVTRVSNIYVDSGLTMTAFVQRLYSARSRTKERYASIRDRSKRFAYFCALLEEECGLREPPPEIAAAARDQGKRKQQSSAKAARRKSLAGRYWRMVQR